MKTKSGRSFCLCFKIIRFTEVMYRLYFKATFLDAKLKKSFLDGMLSFNPLTEVKFFPCPPTHSLLHTHMGM